MAEQKPTSVRMRTLIAGPGVNAQPNAVVRVSQKMARALLAGGFAVVEIETQVLGTARPRRQKPYIDDNPDEPEELPPEGPPYPAEDEEEEERAEQEGTEGTEEGSSVGSSSGQAHDPTLEELGMEGETAELLTAAGLLTRSAIEAAGDLTCMKGIGNKTAAAIAAAVDASYQDADGPQ